MGAPNKLKITNRSSSSMRLILEPWAEEYCVAIGSTVEVFSDKQSDKEIEMEYDGEDLIVFGWSDSMTVQCDGKKIDPHFD